MWFEACAVVQEGRANRLQMYMRDDNLDAFKERFGREKPNDWLLALEQALLTGHEKGGIIPAMLLGETKDVSLVTGADGQTEPTTLHSLIQ